MVWSGQVGAAAFAVTQLLPLAAADACHGNDSGKIDWPWLAGVCTDGGRVVFLRDILDGDRIEMGGTLMPRTKERDDLVLLAGWVSA